MTPTELYTCLRELFASTEYNNLQTAISLLKPLDKQTRKKVVNTPPPSENRTVLFLASLKGYVHFVNYFLDECSADIEQKGVYVVQEDQTKHLVTPLWAAAVSNKLDVVRTLVKHGADINGESDTQSTPVRSACYMSNIEIVKFLIENNADIHKPNIHGGTCLINSIQSVELCEYLLANGALVNEKDQSGNIALHYAIREGRLESTRLLVEHESDVWLKNELGDDALQTACLRGFEEIVEYLIDTIKPTKDRIVDSYEVMGANFIDEKHDINQGLAYWRLALGLRLAPPAIPKHKSDEVHHFFKTHEFSDFDDLKNIEDDPDRVYVQSLMVRERVLGPTHKDTAFGLMYRGAVYADTHRYKKCASIWTYALEIRHKHCDPLSHETVLINLHSLTKLFWELWLGRDRDVISFDDVYKVVDILVLQIQNRKSGMPVEEGLIPRDYVQTTMLLGLHLINLITKMTLNNDQSFQLKRLIHRFISTRVRTRQDRGLLHAALDYKSNEVDNERCSILCSYELISLLVECGADINARDVYGNTPLHILAKSMTMDKTLVGTYKEVAHYLLDEGAHHDVRNLDGLPAWEKLSEAGCVIQLGRFLSLRCLAARCIAEKQVPYEGEIPITLEPFVKVH